MEDLYLHTLAVCEEYLGDQAKRFLDRQISSHLGKTPGALLESDMEELERWLLISSGLLFGEQKAREMCQRIRQNP